MKLSKQPKYIFRKPVLYRISSKRPAATRNSRLVGTFEQGVKNYRARYHSVKTVITVSIRSQTNMTSKKEDAERLFSFPSLLAGASFRVGNHFTHGNRWVNTPTFSP